MPSVREAQRSRTRRALIAAADELFKEGRVPTVAEVAERAEVGRATAYRYFPTQEALLLETTFLGDQEPLRALPELVGEIEDPAERVARAVKSGAHWTLEREARLRMILRASLDPAGATKRPARRRRYIADLLASVKDELPKETYERLTGALTLLLGIDPIVAIADNSDIDRQAIPDVLAWAAESLVSAARQPPATAGRMVTSSPSSTDVSRPSRKRMSSPST
jgi:AcrR family transcriptional regulator